MRIADLFAGGGGASIGLAAGTGHEPMVAINHSAIAIAVHEFNHPTTKHYIEDVWQVDPLDACDGMDIDILWASPDCTHFSNAKAASPKENNIRCLAWVVVKWAMAVHPKVIFVENVPEFLTWGPLDDAGTPIAERAGETFELWVYRLRELGYEVQWRSLNACDYGAPTSRKRLFIVARCDGMPIQWPKPSHGPGRAKPFRTAAECIDWSIPCPSIFLTPEQGKAIGVRRPLAEKTMWRIANGIRRYVLNSKSPFIVRTGHHSPASGQGRSFRGQGVDTPIGTVCTVNDKAVVDPLLSDGSLTAPLSALVLPRGDPAACRRWLADNDLVGAPFLFGAGGPVYGAKPKDVNEPLPTVMTENHRAIGVAFMAKHFGGVVGRGLDEPASTVKPRDNQVLVTSHLVKLRGTARDGQAVDIPLPTVTAGGFHLGEVRAFLTKHYGTACGQDLGGPLHTVTARDRFGLIVIDGTPWEIVDIGMRMLAPHELAAAQFGKYTDRMAFSVLKTTRNGGSAPLSNGDITRLIGNSVPPEVAEALVRANPPA